MLPFGHISAGYLISQIPNRQKPLRWFEVIFVVICANIFDIDYALPQLLGLPPGTHHYLPTHTPLMAIIYLAILFFVLRKWFRPIVFIYAGVAMMSHFVLDDLSWWIYLAGFGGQTKPQIFWLYPFDPRLTRELATTVDQYNNGQWGQVTVAWVYLHIRPLLFYVEIALTSLASSVFIWTRVRGYFGGRQR